MTTQAQYAATPNNGTPVIALTANGGTKTTPTNTVTVFTAGASGSRIDDLYIAALGTNIANTISLYLYDGSTYHLFNEQATAAITPAAGTPVFQLFLTNLAIIIKTGWSLRAGVTSTEANGYKIAVTRGGDL